MLGVDGIAATSARSLPTADVDSGKGRCAIPASRFTKAANTPKKKRTWEHVYASAKKRGASPSSAIRQANSVVKKKRGR